MRGVASVCPARYFRGNFDRTIAQSGCMTPASASPAEPNPLLGNDGNAIKARKCSMPANCPTSANQEQASMLKFVPNVATGLMVIAP